MLENFKLAINTMNLGVFYRQFYDIFFLIYMIQGAVNIGKCFFKEYLKVGKLINYRAVIDDRWS